jgi:DNA repair protein RecO (recombination protein O)
LAKGDDLEALLRQFELRLLDELGYGLTLDRVADDDAPVLSEGFYVYEREHGLRHATADTAGFRLSGGTLLALARGEPLGDSQRREARTLLRAVLEPHLGGRPLRSRELYRQWFGAGAAADGAGAGSRPARNQPN